MDHISCADWRSFAGANTPELFGLQGANFIVDIGGVVGDELQHKGIPANLTHIIGHSWGTLVGYEAARKFPDKVQSFVSLDTSSNPFILADIAGSGYDASGVGFTDIARTSWAFEGSIYGDDHRSSKADMTMRTEFPFEGLGITRHGLVVETFTQIINEQIVDADDPVAKQFSLQHLISGNKNLWPWKTDGWDGLGILPQGYEGTIISTDTGNEFPDGKPIYRITGLEYRKKDDGSLDTLEPS